MTATNASAQDTVSCERTGSTIEWTSTNQTVHVRGYQSAAGDDSVWIASFDQDVSTYNITDADLAKAPGDRFFIRYRVGGQVVEAECTSAGEPPANDLICTQIGGELAWSQLDVSRNVFHVRSVNPEGTTSWVASVQGADVNTFDVVDGVPHQIRYRITSSPGNTQVFNVPCTQDDPPMPVECSLVGWSFGTDLGWLIVIENTTTIGDSWSLIENGVPTGDTRSEPSNPDETIDGVENVYFGIGPQATPRLSIAVAPTNDLGASVPCGSIGEDPSEITACQAVEADGGNGVTLFLSPANSYLETFSVLVDGDEVDFITNFVEWFPGSFLEPPVSYTVANASLTNAFEILTADGTVIGCTGDEVNFCSQSAGFVTWQTVSDPWNDEYNVRRVDPDGSNRWVATTFGNNTSVNVGDGEFFIRYRLDDGAGNLTVVDTACVPE